MKKMIVEIQYDDTDGYDGKGAAHEVIMSSIWHEMDIELAGDSIIKPAFSVELKSLQEEGKPHAVIFDGTSYFVEDALNYEPEDGETEYISFHSDMDEAVEEAERLNDLNCGG